MQIAVFENLDSPLLVLTIEPAGERHEVPFLASIGIRYSFEAGAERFSHSTVKEHQIDFWCEDPAVEVDIVLPTAFDRLLWEICAGLGYCAMGEGDMFVTDLLPATGVVTAEEFAKLVLEGDAGEFSKPEHERRALAALETAFVEHIGAASVRAEALQQNLRRPFDPPAAS